MIWTKEKPTQPGWYWHRGVRSDKAEVVRVFSYIHHNSTLSMYYTNDTFLYTIPNDGVRYTGEWSDTPIPIPEEHT